MSSVVYEAPNPSKGFNFFNFKPLKEGATSNLIEEVNHQQQQQQQHDKTSFKRENQVHLATANQFNLANPNQVNLGLQDQVSFPSFFNSEAIDEELKNYQDQIHGENSEKNEANLYLGFQKHVVPIKKQENSIDFDQVLIQ